MGSTVSVVTMLGFPDRTGVVESSEVACVWDEEPVP